MIYLVDCLYEKEGKTCKSIFRFQYDNMNQLKEGMEEFLGKKNIVYYDVYSKTERVSYVN